MTPEALAGVETPVRVPLGQLLIRGGFVTQAQLDDALYEGSRTGERLGEVVVRCGFASEEDVAQLLAEQWQLDYVDRSSIWFDADALARLSREDAQRLEALPTRVEGGRVVVAVAEPTEQRLAALRHVIGEETVVIVVPKSALDAGLRSDLLRSSGVVTSTPPAPTPAPPAPAPPPPAPDPVPEPPPERELPPAALAPVTTLPVHRPHVDVEVEVDRAPSVLELVDEAEAVAQRLTAQAAAVRAQQDELRLRVEAYESRIHELEETILRRDEQLARVRSQLTELLGSFED